MQVDRTKLPIFTMHCVNAKTTVLIVLVFLSSIISSSLFSQNSVTTVVIDAGHGGKDPGCHGKFSKEKHVCLSMALKLGKLIKAKYPDIQVIYTRDTDIFVELAARANIANKANADLFICIHANAASPAAYGTETYVLGLHRTDAQQKVASRENSIIELEKDGGAKYKDFNMTADAIIAKRLQLSVFLDQAILFAQNIQKEFKSIGRKSRGVKQAGFVVLYRTTMPSVLIETGFLTNPNEELFISKEDGQNKMANAMLKAFIKYKNELEGTDSDVVIDTVKEPEVTTPEVTIKETNFIEKIEKEINTNKGLIFRVQILTTAKELHSGSSKLKSEQDVFQYYQSGLYKYCSGKFTNDLKSAQKHKNKMREKGFNGAFVIAFLDGERIGIEKAIKLVEN